MNVYAKNAETDEPDFTIEANAASNNDEVFCKATESSKPDFASKETICADTDFRVFAKTSETAKPEWKKPVDLCGEPPVCPLMAEGDEECDLIYNFSISFTPACPDYSGVTSYSNQLIWNGTRWEFFIIDGSGDVKGVSIECVSDKWVITAIFSSDGYTITAESYTDNISMSSQCPIGTYNLAEFEPLQSSPCGGAHGMLGGVLVIS